MRISKKTLLTCIGASAFTAALMAEIPPSVATRLAMMKQTSPLSREQDEPPFQPIMIEIGADSVISTLENLGVIIYNRRGDILLTSVPANAVEEVLTLPGVINSGISGDMSRCLDKARPMGRVDEAQAGAGDLPHGFTGEGVVVGITDIGFDPKHISLRDKVAALYHADPQYAREEEASTPEAISRWATDNPEEYHATHVANILCGEYSGNPYSGVATGAELVATTSSLSDVGILNGVEYIISYAKSRDKRAVINMSLGNSLGPHDGTSIFCRYLSMCAQEAVICLSAGNTAQTTSYASHTFKAPDDIRRLLVNSLITYNGFDVMGYTEVWSANARPLSMRIEVYDMDTREIAYASPWIGVDEDADFICLTPQSAPQWGQMMGGMVYAASGIDPNNGRYAISVGYDTHTEEAAAISEGRWSRYYTCIAVKATKAKPDYAVDAAFFADATYSYIGLSALPAPTISAAGSISDMCTAQGVVSVGACSSRNSAPSLLCGEVSWAFPINEISAYSSYSASPYIKPLPHLAAPGSYIVSAMSGPCFLQEQDMSPDVAAKATVEGDDYYWISEGGTSMASPYVAGVMAMWLQADPSLSTARLLEIAQSTASTDYSDYPSAAWGAGCIDAYAGLQKILDDMGGIADARRDPYFTVNPDRTISAASANSDVALYVTDVAGRRVNHSSPLPPGIYIVALNGRTPTKVMVK